MSAPTMREQFEAWHRAEYPNDPMLWNEFYGYVRVDVSNRWRGWRAARAATQPIPTGDATDSDWGAFVEASEDER